MPFPRLEFRHFICTFLQAVPLSTIIYLILRQSFQFLKALPALIEALALVVLTCIIGLFVDGFRHELERFFNKKWNKKTWYEMTRQDASAALNPQVYIEYALIRSRDWHHLYEFYANFAICMIVTIILILFPCFSFIRNFLDKTLVLKISFSLGLITLYSIYSSYATSRRHNEWLKRRVKLTKKEVDREFFVSLAGLFILIWFLGLLLRLIF